MSSCLVSQLRPVILTIVMLNVAIKLIILNVITLANCPIKAIMLTVVMLNVNMLSVAIKLS
jgi:hypothetical protein